MVFMLLPNLKSVDLKLDISTTGLIVGLKSVLLSTTLVKLPKASAVLSIAKFAILTEDFLTIPPKRSIPCANPSGTQPAILLNFLDGEFISNSSLAAS